jgi:hypothetical protein
MANGIHPTDFARHHQTVLPAILILANDSFVRHNNCKDKQRRKPKKRKYYRGNRQTNEPLPLA